MNNMILAFSDGSLQLSTSAVYLVSFNPNDHEYAVTLISTLSRLGQMSAKQGEESDVNTIPKRECFGLYLSTCGANTLANLLKTLNLPINKVYIFCDAIAHIIALKRSPSCYKVPYNRLYAEINSLTYQIGNLTSQPKETIVIFLQQKVYFNPSDLISKFDLDRDSFDM